MATTFFVISERRLLRPMATGGRVLAVLMTCFIQRGFDFIWRDLNDVAAALFAFYCSTIAEQWGKVVTDSRKF